MCEKIFSERAKFFCSRAAFKSNFFAIFLFTRFDYVIVIYLGSF